MAYEEALHSISMTASADLSTYQYHFVKVSGSRTVTVCTAVTDCPLGILQNKPASGEEATIAVGGVSKFAVGADITAGDYIGTDATGNGVAKTNATHFAIGRALESIDVAITPTAAELGSVLITGPFRPANAS